MGIDKEPLVYSAAEVQTLLGLSRSAVYARIKDGSLPSIRIGGRLLVPRLALQDLLMRETTRAE